MSRPDEGARPGGHGETIAPSMAALTTFALLAASPPAALLPSRIQMAFTLAYHIILVPLGVALLLLTVLMEGVGLRRNDPIALRLARRWSVVMAVQFAVGAVAGLRFPRGNPLFSCRRA
jgi:Cytochrome bd terminal oxidase subunit I